jgi:bifunctional non-homologous end joining protein LigD
MLADSIEPTSLPQYVANDRFAFQQKVDGERVLIRVTPEGAVIPLDRRGEPKAKGLPSGVRKALGSLTEGPWLLDGELLGDELWLFDIALAGDLILSTSSYRYRHSVLQALMLSWRPKSVRFLPTAWTPEDKVALVRAVLEAGGEGIIVRDTEGRYMAGRRAPVLLKAKFVKTMDVVVTGRGCDGKDNLSIAVYDQGRLVDLGTVTAMAGDGPTLQPGQVCEVRYLYANLSPEGPRLVQVTLPKLRTDKVPHECTLDQAKWLNRTVVTWT